MDYDILVKIFMSLNVMDLISVVSQVCSSWRSACCDPILWKKLDLCIQISDSCMLPYNQMLGLIAYQTTIG